MGRLSGKIYKSAASHIPRQNSTIPIPLNSKTNFSLILQSAKENLFLKGPNSSFLLDTL